MTVTINRQPQNITADINTDAYFDVIAQSDADPATITYQWYETGSGILAGETNFSLTVSNVQSADNGNQYYVEATDADGTVQSNTATLSVYEGDFQITAQPQNLSVTEGEAATFSITVGYGLVAGNPATTYQWFENGAPMPGETANTLSFTAQLSDDDNLYRCDATDVGSSTTLQSADAKLDVYATVDPLPPPPKGRRTALVWNWSNGTWTWMDASHAVQKALQGVVCMNYGFDPGWQYRWQGWLDSGKTWSELLVEDTRWSELSTAADEKNMYWLTNNFLLRGDQNIETNNGKDYFVERQKLDLDDMVPDWTSDSFKHLRQFYFHLQSHLPTGFQGWNSFDLTLGWSINLMDPPDWREPLKVTLNKTNRGGKYKADLRTTGRYLSVRMDFDDTQAIQMTGGELDAEEAHGR